MCEFIVRKISFVISHFCFCCLYTPNKSLFLRQISKLSGQRMGWGMVRQDSVKVAWPPPTSEKGEGQGAGV